MKTKNKQPIAGAASSNAIIGHFEGECADSNITNLNGLDITREVWETVFDSEDYKKAIELGHYIGFLGHPEDPNCMDFEHACIVMTEGHIDDNGKIYGKFNLIDTPVGKIVKSFIDAGVQFGISVRGAGDIIDNSVEPESFVFRGFDLVTFPAYPESIPTFSEVAASTDLQKRAKYKAVCSAVSSNLNKISSASALDVIKSQFAPQSDEYKAVEARESELEDAELDDGITAEKLTCMTKLYLAQVKANKQLKADNEAKSKQIKSIQSAYSRKLRALKKITAAQVKDAEFTSIRASKFEAKYKTVSAANAKLKSEVESSESSNLKYKQRIESATQQLRDKDAIISSLRLQLDETVSRVSSDEARTSNLDATNKRLKSQITAAHKLLAEYQEAYANLYASVIGAKVDSIPISSDTSVADMHKILGSTSTCNIAAIGDVGPEVLDIADDDDNMITL